MITGTIRACFQKGAHPLGAEAGGKFQPPHRSGARRPGLAAQGVVVGDIGQLGEDRKSPDQQDHVGLGQAHQQPVQRNSARAGAIIAHRLAADVFHQGIGAGAMLLADDLAQKPPQQANGGAVFRGVFCSMPIGGL